jgi:hypothetical protein
VTGLALVLYHLVFPPKIDFNSKKKKLQQQIWDLRTGGIFETIKYDHGVTALQFDSRKVISAAGENGVKVSGYILARRRRRTGI